MKLSSIFILFYAFILNSYADTINIAVATNFAPAAKEIVKLFELKTNHKAKLIFASSGIHYAQIINGAPFDLFLSADSKRPQMLEQEDLIVKGSRFIYAVGKVVLWSKSLNLSVIKDDILSSKTLKKIAIANPKLAPYGLAARQFLESKKLYRKLQTKMVVAATIGQCFQFVHSENVDLGIVAKSQVIMQQSPHEFYWEIPQIFYDKIIQEAVLLNSKKAVKEFANFLKKDIVKKIILKHGYEVL